MVSAPAPPEMVSWLAALPVRTSSPAPPLMMTRAPTVALSDVSDVGVLTSYGTGVKGGNDACTVLLPGKTSVTGEGYC